MDLSGVIFVVLAVAWAGYLIPKALRHHDEVSRTRSVDRSSDSARVLAHREADRRDSRLVVRRRPRSASATPTTPSARTVTPPAVAPRAHQARPAGRAARRRRRLLAVLVLASAGTATAGYLGYAPWWTVGAPAAVTLAFLVLCVVAARRHRRSARSTRARARSTAAPGPLPVAASEPVEPVVAPEVFDGQAVEPRPAEPQPAVEHVDVALVDPEPQVVEAVGGTLWDPLPITLPTYITKPTARRTVRTIDLTEPGTWTSGHTAADAEIAARAAGARIPQQRSEEAGQRVANS